MRRHTETERFWTKPRRGGENPAWGAFISSQVSMTEREFALDVVRKLHLAGFTALLAGGCVRDELLGLTPADYDVATNAEPKQLPPLFKRRNEIGAHFGVVQVIGPRGDDGEWLTVEVATFRIDGPYDPSGRTPDWVKFCSPEEDAKRRDFTINGMFFDPLNNKLIDYVGGRADLDAKTLRAIGNPTERFTEDKLRILRAVRMAARFDLTIDPDTLAAAKRMAAEIRIVSAERIAEELRKMLSHPNRACGVRLLREFDLIEPILPELVPAGTIWDHTVRMVEALGCPHPPTPSAVCPHPPTPSPQGRGGVPGLGGEGVVSFPLAFAAVLHSLDKETVEAIADRLRLSTIEKTRVAWLVENQSCLANAQTMRASKLYPILVHPGIDELIALHRANALASGKSLAHVEFCEKLLWETPREVLNPVPVVTGDDLIALGMKPGKDFKRLLDAVREAQLEGRVKEKGQGLELVHQLRSAAPPASEKPPE
jgi:poly(A) polymerase